MLEDADELVLLGDLFDFLFSSVENAFAQADGFFSLLEEKMAGKRIVFSCGNHDHHIVVRDLRTAVELKVITATKSRCEALAMQRNFFQRFLHVGRVEVLPARSPWALTRTTATARGLLVTAGSSRLAGTLRPLKALDLTGEKARAVKARYVGVGRGCGAYTQPHNGKGDAYAYCKACHPGGSSGAGHTSACLRRCGSGARDSGRCRPRTTGPGTHARRRGGDALARLAQGEWPAASVVTRLFGTWSAARAVAAQRAEEMTREPAPASSSFGRESSSLSKPRESTAKTEDLRGGEPQPDPIDLQVLLTAPADCAHNSGR